MGEYAEDGLPVQDVGNWAAEKHSLVTAYVDITRATRRKYLTGRARASCYIDLYSGPGRARIRESGVEIDGSPIAAWKASVAGQVPFSKVIIADQDRAALDAARQRLEREGAPVVALHGSAEQVVEKAVEEAGQYGLHFAFLDPFNLHLPFRAIEVLATLRHVDMLVHLSTGTLQRNFHNFAKAEQRTLDAFAPGWRQGVSGDASPGVQRQQLLSHWHSLAEHIGFTAASDPRRIANSKNVGLYWFVLLTRHDLAGKFWHEVARYSTPQASFAF